MKFMAIDQYGTTYHNLISPRKDLCKRMGRQHADKIYQDKKDGSVVHVGYIIGRLWLTLYTVEPFEKIV